MERDRQPPASTAPADEGMRPNDHRRLWTPWRMRYVGGETPSGCVFCARVAGSDDAESLILLRGDHAFAIMNRYPYNTGHVMLVPNEHVATPEDAALSGLTELATLLPATLRALRRVLGCDGFNVGFNVGADAGAGVADHLHQHVVPRWEGDANFMPILAATMVLPELIPVTYAKLRAELSRELSGANRVSCVALAADRDAILAVETDAGWRLPIATADASEPLWRTSHRLVTDLSGAEPEIAGWAGPSPANQSGVGLAFSITAARGDDLSRDPAARWLATDEVRLLGPDAATAANVVAARVAGEVPS